MGAESIVSLGAGLLGQSEETGASAENIQQSAAALIRATQMSQRLFGEAQTGLQPFTNLADPALAEIRSILQETEPSAAARVEAEDLTRSQAAAAAAAGKLGSGEHLRKLVAGSDVIADRELQRRMGRLLDVANLGRGAAGTVAELAGGTAANISGIETGTQTALNTLRSTQAAARSTTLSVIGQGIETGIANR